MGGRYPSLIVLAGCLACQSEPSGPNTPPASTPGPTASAKPAADWRELQPGVEHRAWPAVAGCATDACLLHVVRVQPRLAQLEVVAAAEQDSKNRTAGSWAKHAGLSVVINAGMYAQDHSTHVGYLRRDGRELTSAWARDYESVFVLGPKNQTRPFATIVDLDVAGRDEVRHYRTAVQNLRLLKAPGHSVWKNEGRRWSEAALGLDGEGRILMIFLRAPRSMVELNQLLLKLPLDVVRAQHLEGGPEASLSIHAGGVDMDLAGSYESGFNENHDNSAQWKLPNVIGVKGM